MANGVKWGAEIISITDNTKVAPKILKCQTFRKLATV